ncbi:MAG TPA: nicotinate-nucleotide adenylyltransferase, partial [Acidimicrobiia bacterium]|nr:nicotinate-nucleotide adenylyltransferase [Acidimicrobiia bacterium]
PTRCLISSVEPGARRGSTYFLPHLVPMLDSVSSGLMGGTFDPPHIAHLLAGEVAYRQLGLDRVLFIPAGSPWQKAGNSVSPASMRWEMTKRATQGVDYFLPDEREVHRQGWTFTADTLSSFPADEELWLILGADAARGLPTWERADEVMTRARVAVLPRPGVDPAEVEDAIGPALWLDMAPVAISGTDIRHRVASKVGYRFMVTEAVYEYIETEHLYASPESADEPGTRRDA